ncbi:ferredoxin subunit of nitrite reductase and ring-hydroxylating dioxygenase [Corynebacterium mustelae]|uniref:Ferredoxin subunit of nitrite reductase and ring-hydroxylating dioxygenase n=1 Tax=Corynebacterium mustelae TaxID=571915 RepID=A0A0G3H678_9CORY|nr:Rieske (2Fe-2S) protein [Corynebacterium mustelae]AKK07358.1 ferredoxin subunit of nitrite reductase and ring-hydroxylating dioxygenase [Corynebacterium mustelae]
MTDHDATSCSRRMFLIGTATTFAGAVLAACSSRADKISVTATDVPVGSAVIDGDIIIAQPVAGEYKAYSSICPHQGYPITQVTGSAVRCTRHGSTFDIVDGSVIDGPSRDGLRPRKVTLEGETFNVAE